MIQGHIYQFLCLPAFSEFFLKHIRTVANYLTQAKYYAENAELFVSSTLKNLHAATKV